MKFWPPGLAGCAHGIWVHVTCFRHRSCRRGLLHEAAADHQHETKIDATKPQLLMNGQSSPYITRHMYSVMTCHEHPNMGPGTRHPGCPVEGQLLPCARLASVIWKSGQCSAAWTLRPASDIPCLSSGTGWPTAAPCHHVHISSANMRRIAENLTMPAENWNM